MYEIEKQFLGRYEESALYNLSLLYRFYDAYDKERELVQHALALYPYWNYFQEREAWHEKPLFDRLVPRPLVDVPRTPPSQEVLEQLCFITGTDQNPTYFTMLIELVESIRATTSYKDIPIYVFDFGMTEDQQKQLTDMNLHLHVPGWDWPCEVWQGNVFDPVYREKSAYKSMTSRPFVERHVPGYRYYFYIDADIWFQTEQAIDEFVLRAVNHGAAVVYGVLAGENFSFDGSNWQQFCKDTYVIPPYWDALLKQGVCLSAGSVCVDATSQFLPRWQEHTIEAYHTNNFIYAIDELALIYVYNRYYREIPVVEFHQQYCVLDFNLPYRLPLWKDGVLYSPVDGKTIGSLHLCGFPKRKDHFHSLANTRDPNDLIPPRTMQSLRFRVWPWADKKHIRTELKEDGIIV